MIRTFTADPADVAAYGAPTDDGGRRRYKVRVVDRHPDRVVARVDGIADRTAAEGLKGTRLYVNREALPDPDDEEFYHVDLIGCAAVLTGAAGDVGGEVDATGDNDVSGTVTAVHDFGAGAVLEIDLASGASLMVPFSRACVPEVDLGRRRLRIVPEPGLLDETAANPKGPREDR